MSTRRQFLQNSTVFATASLTNLSSLFAETGLKAKMGIQLFSLPKMLSTDFEGGIKMLSKMGYKELELFGPFPFSTDTAKAGWKAAESMLGFSGSGYFGRSVKDVKKILTDNGLKTPAMHSDLDTMTNNMGKIAESAHILGQKYVTLPAIPEDKRQTLDDYKKIADTFNTIGQNAKKNGLKLGYHNHGYGLVPANGIMPLEIIIKNTDPKLVFLELDIFWTACAGIDPISLLTKYPNRYKMLHLKDMKEKKQFEGDGGGMSQWMPMFPYMTTAGNGVLDLKGIMIKAKEIGVEHYFVEQDMVAEPEIALKKSIDFLKKLA